MTLENLVDDLTADWRNQAACWGMDYHLFFPDSGHQADEALAACQSCPVTLECLDLALTADASNQHGIFGGVTADKRKAIKYGRTTFVRARITQLLAGGEHTVAELAAHMHLSTRHVYRHLEGIPGVKQRHAHRGIVYSKPKGRRSSNDSV